MPLKVLIITGGHDFDREPFFEMFDSMDGYQFTESIQPEANQLIETGEIDQYDLLIFYDMYDSITVDQQTAYVDLFNNGFPALFLHHSLVSYQDWDEFIEIIGGKYVSMDSLAGVSNYLHDTDISVRIIQKDHPLTSGLSDFEIFDETYGNCRILEKVEPLLSTDHPQSMPYIGWINTYGKSKIVYLQSGHGPGIFDDPNYRLLLEQSMDWLIQNN